MCKPSSLMTALVLTFLVSASPVARADTLHVSPIVLPGIPAAQQWRTISAAASKARPGDTVLIHAGVYRETVVVEQSGSAERPIRFHAAAGESVTITGADSITDWRKELGDDSIFSTPWPYRFAAWSKTGTHPDDAYHHLIGRCEQVFYLGYPVQQVLDRSRVGRGTFYVDLAAARLFMCAPNGEDLSRGPPTVEASVRDLLWHSKGTHIELRGLRFRYAANQAQSGAARFEGAFGLIEDCIFERVNSSGATFLAQDLIIRRCTFQDNGQLGFGAFKAHRLLFTECVVRNNNTKGFNRQWEAGGNKIVLSRGVVLERSQFIANRGNGVWFDIGNEQSTVRNCLIADNEDAGIFYEISYSLHAHDNVITGNGFADTPGNWGAAAGISLSSSPDCLIERNLVVANREGFNFREQFRKTPRIDDNAERPIWNHDQIIRNNILALNRDAQVQGWFDTGDRRHWPQGMKDSKDPIDLPQIPPDTPRGLTLEKLNFAFSSNLYFAQPWQGLFNWGASWKVHRQYRALEALRDELKLDQAGQVSDPLFANPAARDFRLPADSPAIKMGAYPSGEVPGCRIGTITGVNE